VEQIVEHLRYIAFADIGQVVEWDEGGIRIRSSAELTAAQRAVISEVSETSTKIGAELVNTKKTLKFHNKLTALDMLMKHLGGYESDNRQKRDTDNKRHTVQLPDGTIIELWSADHGYIISLIAVCLPCFWQHHVGRSLFQ
jgi:hypothetical protein